MDAKARSRLLAWYDKGRRDLPWRRTGDPYAIWISEVMLQQTRVQTAIPYFERWMAQFPAVSDLAAASEEEVLAAWSGLGYYTRARSLHRAAGEVVAKHGGQLPGTAGPGSAAGLLQLPGIGPYTAGAIASIAFGERVPAVDGNVVRVAARLAGIEDPAIPEARRKIDALAASWVPEERPGDWNQALMELGATVCLPKAPKCGTCPVTKACTASRTGKAHTIPAPRKRPDARVERMQFAVVIQAGALLLVRNPGRLLGGLWSLPGGPAGHPLAKQVKEQTGVAIRVGAVAAGVRHTFTHLVWEMEVWSATVQPKGKVLKRAQVGQGAPPGQVTWMPIPRIGDSALSTAMRTALRAAGVAGVA